jgi:hypothetical protein
MHIEVRNVSAVWQLIRFCCKSHKPLIVNVNAKR